MIDLETMGTNPHSPIVAIGAVFFNPVTGELGKTFYRTVDLESSMKLGLTPTANTIKWWMNQDKKVVEEVIKAKSSITDALTALSQFAVFAYSPAANYGGSLLKIWGNGSAFDNVILRESYKACHLTPFWEFWNDMDVRTIVDMGRCVGFDPKRDIPFDGDRHNALADAVHQAKYVSAIYKKLLNKPN